MPEAEAKKTKGTTWWAHVKKGSDGVWGGWTVCEELPQYNLWMAFRDGEEKELEWVHFGEGKFMVRRGFWDGMHCIVSNICYRCLLLVFFKQKFNNRRLFINFNFLSIA